MEWPRPASEGFRMILDAAIIIGSLWISEKRLTLLILNCI